MNGDPGQKRSASLSTMVSPMFREAVARGGRIADVDHMLAFLEQEVVHHVSVRGDRLGRIPAGAA